MLNGKGVNGKCIVFCCNSTELAEASHWERDNESIISPSYMHICIHSNINYKRRKRKRRTQDTAYAKPVFFFFNFRLLQHSKFPGIIRWCGVSSLFLATFPKQCRIFGLTVASISWLTLSCRWFNLFHIFLTLFSCLVYSHHCFGLVWFWICDMGTPSFNRHLDTGSFGGMVSNTVSADEKWAWPLLLLDSLPSFQCTYLMVAIRSTNP